MEIKPVTPGNVNLNAPEDPAPAVKPAKPGAAPASGAPSDAAPSGPLDSVRPEFGRADLMTDRKEPLVRRTVDTLIDSSADSMGALPEPARDRIADLLSADPLFSSRVLNYWNNNLD